MFAISETITVKPKGDRKMIYDMKYEAFREIIKRQHHTLIAGCSGSGKSVVEHILLYTMMESSPYDNLFVLIDTKRVELIDFKDAPHTVKYTDDVNEVPFILKKVQEIMDARFQRMQAQRLKKTNEPTLWIVFDEYYDIVSQLKKSDYLPILNRLSSAGRAAGICIILCTQRCTRDVISGMIQGNFAVMLGLRTRTAQDSRNILGMNGCEKLPKYGKGILQIDGINQDITIPMVRDELISERVNAWNSINWKQIYRQ